MNKLQYHSNEFFVLWNYPTKEQYTTHHGHPNVFPSFHEDMYNKAIKACIAAKTRIDNKELLPVVNYAEHCDSGETGWFYQDRYEHSHPTGLKGIKDGDIFDLPDNVEFEEQYICSKYNKKCGPGCLVCSGNTLLVIHLKLKQEDDPFEDMVKNNPTVVRYDDDANL